MNTNGKEKMLMIKAAGSHLEDSEYRTTSCLEFMNILQIAQYIIPKDDLTRKECSLLADITIHIYATAS